MSDLILATFKNRSYSCNCWNYKQDLSFYEYERNIMWCDQENQSEVGQIQFSFF